MTTREHGYEESDHFEVESVRRGGSEILATRWATLLFSLGCWAMFIWAIAIWLI